ncbi:MAG: hypothetical protein MRK00_05635 [Nitrosomonas sp.]|nr:hypothetical protein [Nitrosomonas sp.]
MKIKTWFTNKKDVLISLAKRHYYKLIDFVGSAKSFFISKKKILSDFFVKQTNPYLSSYIKREKKRVSKSSGILDKFKLDDIYQPSIKSFSVILLGFVLIFILAHWSQSLIDLLGAYINRHYPFETPAFPTIKNEDNQNLIAALAGIGVIVFALTIFIAESFRDGSTDKGRVLLKESNIWPLTVSVVLSFLLFLWGNNNIIIYIPIILVALFSLLSLARVIGTLLNRVEFVKKRRTLLKELMQRSIDLAIESRLADNIFLSKLDEQEILIQFHLFSIDRTSDLICLKSKKFGRIKDINLLKLEDFSKLLNKEAVKNGFSYEEVQEKSIPKISVDGSVNESSKIKLQQNTKRYILKKYNDLIDEEHCTLICYDRNLIGSNEEVRAELERIFEQIFSIEKTDSFAEEVRLELQNLRDDFAAAIKSEASGKVDEHSKTYIALAEGFLEQIIKYGGGYDHDQAVKERTSLFSGWEQVRWLSTDLVDLLELAIKSNNKSIIGTVAFIPIGIARRAIEKHDHYTFQEFIRIVESLYLYSTRVENENIKQFLVDRSWRYIKELCDYYLESSLKKETLTIEEIKSYEGFSIHLIFIFQNLLKMSFDNNDIESFEKFKLKVSTLFEHSHFFRNYSDVRRWDYEIKNKKITEEERISIEEKRNVAIAREVLWKNIESRRKQMLFGIATFVFDQFQKSKEDELLSKFFNSINSTVPNDLIELTRLFQECHSFEVEDFWNWNWWETRPDEGVHSIQVLEKLEKFYAVKSLMLLTKKSEEEIKRMVLPTSRDFVFLVEGSRDLMVILKNIEEHPEDWQFVLNQNANTKVTAFRALLLQAKDAQEEIERKIKIETAPSSKIISNFENDVVKAYYENEQTLTLFKHLKRFRDLSETGINEKGKSRFGINTVDDKAAFFEDWYVSYGKWGENYGRNIATGADSSVLNKIAEKAETINIDMLDSHLEKFDDLSEVVIVSTNIMTVYLFEKNQKILPNWHKDAPKLGVKGFYGWYRLNDKLVPIFEIRHNTQNNYLFIINKNKFGTYVQQSPLNKDEDIGKIKDVFYFDINAFSEDQDLLDEFLDKPPKWLSEIGDRSEQRQHLLQRILITIFIRFDIDWDEDCKIFKIITPDL